MHTYVTLIGYARMGTPICGVAFLLHINSVDYFSGVNHPFKGKREFRSNIVYK